MPYQIKIVLLHQIRNNNTFNHKSKLTNMNISEIMAGLEAKHPGEKEYLQAVKEVLLSVE